VAPPDYELCKPHEYQSCLPLVFLFIADALCMLLANCVYMD